MVELSAISNKLDKEFNIKSYGSDSSFSRFVPNAFDSIEFDWKHNFEKEFTTLFNGLMIKGTPFVHKVFLAVFPTDEILERFISEGNEGDLLFMHHPIVMECGDPNGNWGRGFIPIKESYIRRIKEKKLSVYTCHIPMDLHMKLGPHIAMANELNAEIEGTIEEYILICRVNKTDTNRFVSQVKEIFDIPYVDFEGQKRNDIEKIAIVAGCGDKVEWMKQAQKQGAQAYLTGEIHCHIDNEYGKQRYAEMKEYAKETSMSLIGVSHAASEFITHKTLMNDWFKHHFNLKTVIIPQEKWWV